MIINQDVVDRAWKEVAGYSMDKMAKESVDFAKRQPYLMEYVRANSEELRPEVGELILYLSFVVYKMFATGHDLPKVSFETIDRIDEQNYQSIEALAGENFLDELAKIARPKTLDQKDEAGKHEEQRKSFPFKETVRQQKWGQQHGVEVACPACLTPRFIGRSIYKERFRKGRKCDICDSSMIPFFACKKCKAHLTADVKGDEIEVRTIPKVKWRRNAR